MRSKNLIISIIILVIFLLLGIGKALKNADENPGCSFGCIAVLFIFVTVGLRMCGL